jgi:hypothetical protein
MHWRRNSDLLSTFAEICAVVVAMMLPFGSTQSCTYAELLGSIVCQAPSYTARSHQILPRDLPIHLSQRYHGNT